MEEIKEIVVVVFRARELSQVFISILAIFQRVIIFFLRLVNINGKYTSEWSNFVGFNLYLSHVCRKSDLFCCNTNLSDFYDMIKSAQLFVTHTFDKYFIGVLPN